MDEKTERGETTWETQVPQVEAANGAADAIIRLVLELRLGQEGHAPTLERVIAF